MPQLTFNIGGFVSGSYSNISNQTSIVGNGSNATNYATITMNTGSNAESYAFWSFDCSSIPVNAVINSVSCTAKCGLSSTTRITTHTFQLYNGTSTAKGSAVSFSSAAETDLTCGTWTRSELNQCYIRVYGQRGTSQTSNSATMSFYGATLIVDYSLNGTQYTVTIANNSTYSMTPSGSNTAYEGENYDVIIDVDDIGMITITDNNIDVTSQFTQYYVSDTESMSPSAAVVSGASTGENYAQYAVGHTAENPYNISGTSAIYASNGSTGYVDYSFNISSIPSNAVITSIEVSVTGYRENNTDDATHIAEVRLYSGTTAKGSVQKFTTTSSQTIQIADTGSWTYEELQNIKLRFFFAYYGGLVTGATLNITYQTGSYSSYKYTISNISQTHNIIIEDVQGLITHNISAISNYTNVSITPNNLIVIDGNSVTLTIRTDYDITSVKLLDNDIKVHNNIVQQSSNIYNYTISNINEDHNIILSEKTKYTISPVNNTDIYYINPNEIQTVYEETNNVIKISRDTDVDSTGIVITDNNIDITNTLIYSPHHANITLEKYPATYTVTSGSINNTNYQQAIGKPAASTSAQISNYYASGSSGSTAILEYTFDFSSLPKNLTIVSIRFFAKGHIESTSNSSEQFDMQLYSGNVAKGSSQTFTSTSDAIIEFTNPGTWTYEELQNAKLEITIGYYGGALSGATFEVVYETYETYAEYVISNISDNHIIMIDKIFIPEEEDPEINYYNLTVSAINADIEPSKGTTRVEEGTNQTILIYPSDTLLTLATDNGKDISSQLTQIGGGTLPEATVSTPSGASYSFNYNSSTGYYVSTNNGIANSASVARITFTLPVRCIITFQYINYAEATYDYAIFGNIDVALGTTYTTDTNIKLACSTSAYNKNEVQTLTYEMEAGTHFIDVKYRKDTATDSYNDNLQFKWEITPQETLYHYEYTLNNVDTDHSLLFVFGNVTYYEIIVSSSDAKTYPAGTSVVLENENFELMIIPDDYTNQVKILDNNVDMSANGHRITSSYTKNEQTVYSTNVIYSLSNISLNHNIVISCYSNDTLYIKIDGEWIKVSTIYKKSDNHWEEVNITELNSKSIYILK